MDDDRIAELEREIESLRARLDALAEQGAPGRTSLRIHRRCPVCDHRSVLRIERVADRSQGAIEALAPLIENGFLEQRALGQFVVYVCRQCGLAEWYVARIEEIPLDHPAVRVSDGPPKPPAGSGPFR